MAIFRQKRLLQVFLLVFLSFVAVYLWSAPTRQERRWQKASRTELQQEALRSGSNVNPRLLAQLGKRLMEEGDLPAAYDALTRAADAAPSDAAVWVDTAQVTDRLHGVQGALNLLKTFLRNNPKSAPGYVALANLYEREGQLERARDAADAAVKLDSKNAAAWQIAGRIAVLNSRPEKAMQATKRALELDPDDWQNQMSAGDALSLNERHSEAVPFYRAAIARAPKEAKPYLLLGRALFLSRDSTAEEEAIQSLHYALKLDEDQFLGHFYLAEIAARNRRWPEAVTEYRRALEISPHDLQTLYALSRAYRVLGEHGLADKTLERHKQLTKYSDKRRVLVAQIEAAGRSAEKRRAMRLELARLDAENQEWGRALDQYDLLLNEFPTNTTVQKERTALLALPAVALIQWRRLPTPLAHQEAERLLGKGKIEEALLAYRALIQRDDNDARALQGVGLALLENREWEASANYLLAASQAEPKLWRARFALGDIYQEFGLLDEARQWYRSGLKAAPENAFAWYRLGQISQTNAALKGETVQAFREAVRFAPKNLNYLLALAEAQASAERTDDAEKIYRDALKLNPKSSSVRSQFGAFLVNNRPDQGSEEARRLLESAIADDPTDDFARYNLAVLRLRQGKISEAITPLEDLGRRNPRAVEILGTLAQAYRRAGKLAAAETTMAQADQLQRAFIAYQEAQGQLGHQPDNRGLQLKVARLAAKFGDYPRALAYFTQYLSGATKPEEKVVAQEKAALEKRLKESGQLPPPQLYQRLSMAAHSQLHADNPVTEQTEKP